LKRFFQDIGMVLIPVAKGPIGDRIWSDGTLTWLWTAVGLAISVWLVIGAVRTGDRAMIFGWSWAAVFFFPSWRLSWAERYSYLPSVGLILVVAALINRAPEKRWIPVTACLLVTVTLLALASGIAAANWGWN
jgi:Ni/Fe-hydrogenase subunit HybB-like protein